MTAGASGGCSTVFIPGRRYRGAPPAARRGAGALLMSAPGTSRPFISVERLNPSDQVRVGPFLTQSGHCSQRTGPGHKWWCDNQWDDF
jgi:hypothetical protein